MKTCSECFKLKQLDDFYSCKGRPDGKRGICKECWSNKSKKYREENKLSLVEKHKIYREENKEKLSSRRKEQYPQYRDRVSAYHKKNKDHIKSIKKTYREENKDLISTKFKQWSEKNKEKYLSNRRIKNRLRLKTDPQYRLNKSISERVRASLMSGKHGQSWEDIVGYTIKDLKKTIEKKFLEGMTWDNYGQWHLDHKVPISAFNYKSPEDYDFKRCWSLKNLQPLWAEDNMRKGNRLEKHFQPSLL